MTPVPLAEQRESLRYRLSAQRRQIAIRIDPPNVAYPRSVIMRFLTQQPALAARLFVGIATLLIGARYLKSITSAWTVAQLVRSAASSASPRLPPDVAAAEASLPQMDLTL